MNVKINPAWHDLLKEEFAKPYFENIVNVIKNDLSKGIKIFPKGQDIFNAFELTAPDNIKVVILGQDPYHGINQAHGLSFSVQKGIKLPPSLKNIFIELQNDLGIAPVVDGDLTSWAKQGVLLLNASLTVQESQPNSHAGIGWHQFTDAVIGKIASFEQPIVFLLWGNFAQSKQHLIHKPQHLIIASAHPSPFSVHKGFFNSKPFSKTNNWLITHNVKPVEWSLQ